MHSLPRDDIPLVGQPPPQRPRPVHPLSLPPGWTVQGDTIKPGPLVRDFAARRQDIVGRCESRACDRKVRIDAREMTHEGMGAILMTRLAKQWRCGRLQGCHMSLKGGMMNHDLRLSSIAGRANVRVRLRCARSACTCYRDVPVETVAAAIQPRVSHDPFNVAVADIGPLWRETCPACHGAGWTSQASVIEEGGMDWKRAGEGAWELRAWGR